MPRPVRILILVAATLLPLVFAGTAAAKLSWSTGLQMDSHDPIPLAGISCPTASECAVLDGQGRYLVIDPAPTSSRALPGAYLTAAGAPPTAQPIACPSAVQCSAVFTTGQVSTFDPVTHSTIQPPTRIDGSRINAIACATTSLCVAGDFAGNVVSFDPSDPAAARLTALDPGVDFGLVSLSCPSAGQCTAISQTQEVTFAPASPAGATPVTIVANGLYSAVSCPTTTQCTMVSSLGTEATFDPQAPAATSQVKLDSEEFNALKLACPSASECMAVSQGGRLISFDPQAGTIGITAKPTTDAFYGVSCPTTTSCVAVDDHGLRWVFDPASEAGANSRLIDHGSVLGAVSCAAATQCTALDRSREVTFNPLTRRVAALHMLSNSRLASTYGLSLSSIACFGASDCTATGPVSAFTFNPRRFTTPPQKNIEQYDSSISAVRCVSKSECVAVDSNGYGVVYNPATRTRERFDKVEVGSALGALACASRTQCTAVDNDGNMITFQPLTGRRLATATIDRRVGLDAASGNSVNSLDGISCASVKLCVAVDTLGNEVTFDPRSPRGSVLRAIDVGHSITSVACHGSALCVAVDSSGRALYANLARGTWYMDSPAGAASLLAVTCVSAHECVAVDSTGAAFIARA